MKRLTAVALIVLMLLTWAGAFAESSGTGTRLRLTDVSVSLIGSENDAVANLRDMKIKLYIGITEGIPTAQALLHFSEDQEMELVLQVVGSRLVMNVGGISGTYYVDLESALGEPGKGTLLAGAIGSAMTMFGANPDMVLQMSMPANKNGSHVARFEIQPESYLPVARQIVDALADTELLTEEELASLQNGLLQSEEPIKVEWCYRKRKKEMVLKITQGDKGYRIYSTITKRTKEIDFINISAEETILDLMNLDQDTMDEILGELEFIGIKMIAFFRHSTLKKLI